MDGDGAALQTIAYNSILKSPQLPPHGDIKTKEVTYVFVYKKKEKKKKEKKQFTFFLLGDFFTPSY